MDDATNPSNQPETFGDRAGEHLRMERGRFDAWSYVVLAFLLLVAAFTVVALIITCIVLALVARDAPEHFLTWALVGCALPSVGLVWWMFRNRWRCIEAYSSQFCSGLANLSMFYVPVIAAAYACARASRKLTGRERSLANPPVFYAEP